MLSFFPVAEALWAKIPVLSSSSSLESFERVPIQAVT